MIPEEAIGGTIAARLRGSRRDWSGGLFAAGLLAALLASLAILVALLWDVVAKGAPVLAERGTDFLTAGPSSFPAAAGIGAAIAGSFAMVLIVAVVAFPLGIGAAVYLEEYASDTWLSRLIAANVRNLAGVPSIVYGILGLVLFVEALNHIVDILDIGSLLSGGLTLSALVLPIVIITTSEALRSVPPSLREAAFGVGATRWEVIRHHVLPVAAPGILTGTVLSLARAFGETAPLLLVGAATGFFSTGNAGVLDRLLHSRYSALPVQILNWSLLPDPEFKDLAAAGIVVMMTILLLVNGVAIWLRNRYERTW
ncbi:MAG: phosphate ABC transporter permease PstA [Actinomycetota bacterium]|nr:phosphate ABC transporter permease PstA [Actinomycetota bacterium]